MGLDSNIYAYTRISDDEKIYNKLANEREKPMKILYWRKQWAVIEFFGDLLGEKIENLQEYEIGKIELQALLEALENGDLKYEDGWETNKEEDIAKLGLILNTTGFSETKFVFTNWW